MSEGRFEMKYALPLERRPEVLKLVEAHLSPDPNAGSVASALPMVTATGGPDPRGYRVSSLYFDDDQLTGYTCRIDGRRIRNRIRIRTYGNPGDKSGVFLEAKRKLHKRVIKQRVVPCSAAEWLSLSRPRPWRDVATLADPLAQERLDRWCDAVDQGELHPVCRVQYWRETFSHGTLRLTLDYRVSAEPTRDPLALRGPCSVDLIPREWMVLELKYDHQPPQWMRTLVQTHGLVAEPVSKFALGIARTLRAKHIADQRATTPPSIRRVMRQQRAAK